MLCVDLYAYLTMMNFHIVIPLLKKIQKMYNSHETTLESCWHSYFSVEINNFCFVILAIQIRIEFLILLTWLFKDWFNQFDCHVDGVNKVGYSRNPKGNCILKKKKKWWPELLMPGSDWIIYLTCWVYLLVLTKSILILYIPFFPRSSVFCGGAVSSGISLTSIEAITTISWSFIGGLW